MPHFRPDYTGGGIANLMRTLADACGAPALPQPPLDPRYGLDARTLAKSRNIVLLVVDGLGARQLETHGKGLLRRHAGKRLTSVFPSTTAAAIPTFMTGLSPAQHALTGWHMWLDELQAVTAILPLKPRGGPPFATPAAELPARLFDHRPLPQILRRPAWIVSPQEIAFSPFNTFHARGADTLAYTDLAGLAQNIAGLVRIPGDKFIYAYWPRLDSTAHHFGTGSRETLAVLDELCAAIDALIPELAGSDTTIVLTADHGFIDSPPPRIIELDDHRELADMLARPLCGEQRVAWCYLKPGADSDFEHYVRSRLKGRADVVRSESLVRDGWFGPGQPHPRLASRIGDVALLMRDNWTIKDWLPGERRYSLLGVHGGTSADEMLVPLLVLNA